jgi:hypothetical protein
MTAITLETAVQFVETNFILPELQSQAAQAAGLAINPFDELHMVAAAEAECHQDALRPVDVKKGGYADPISGHKYSAGKAGTKDTGLYKSLMDQKGMTALYDLSVAPILNAIKKFDGVTITRETCGAFYADEKNATRIGKLKNPKSLANAIVKYSPAADDTGSGSKGGSGSEGDGEGEGGSGSAPAMSEFVGQYSAAIAKAETGEIDAITAKAILAALQETMQKEFLKAAGISAKAFDAAQESKIKKTG